MKTSDTIDITDLAHVCYQLDTIAEYDLDVEATHSDNADKDDAIAHARQALRQARGQLRTAMDAIERAKLHVYEDLDAE